MAYPHYVRTVLRRAWREAWNMVVDKSLPALIRDTLFVVVIFGSLAYLAGPLRRAHLIGATANPAVDFGILTVASLCVIGGLFAAYFVIEAVFVTPYRLWREGRAPPSGADPLHLAIWDQVPVLKLYEAACLWDGQEPPGSPNGQLPGGARALLAMLMRAVLDQRIPIDTSTMSEAEKALNSLSLMGIDRPTVTRETEVARGSLIRYAKASGERPAFLFPDARPNPPAGSPSLPKRSSRPAGTKRGKPRG